MKNLLAALASFFIPGLGQLCRMRIFSAIFWFVAASIAHGFGWSLLSGTGYAWVPPFIVHVFSAMNAAKSR